MNEADNWEVEQRNKILQYITAVASGVHSYCFEEFPAAFPFVFHSSLDYALTSRFDLTCLLV